MVLVSIILALGVAQLLGGASEFVRTSRVHLAHSLWVVALLFNHVQWWWALWDLHDMASWTFLTFLYLLLGPVLLFFATNLLVPWSGIRGIDWESHFFTVRRWFFLTMAGVVVWGILILWLIHEVPLSHPYRIAQAGRLAFIAAGIASADRRLHAWLPVGFLLYYAGTTFLFRLHPATFSAPG